MKVERGLVKTIRLLLLIVLGWLAMPASVWAFYNPSTGRWLSRDPIGEVGGDNLYCMVWNTSPNLWDYLGFGCKVEFSCTLITTNWTTKPSISSLVKNCPYACKEVGRNPTAQGTIDCDDVPKNLTLTVDVSVFCQSCPKTTKHYQLFMDDDLKTDCSRVTCRAGCDLTFNKLIASKDPKVRAAALLAKAACYDSCNAICRNP